MYAYMPDGVYLVDVAVSQFFKPLTAITNGLQFRFRYPAASLRDFLLEELRDQDWSYDNQPSMSPMQCLQSKTILQRFLTDMHDDAIIYAHWIREKNADPIRDALAINYGSPARRQAFNDKPQEEPERLFILRRNFPSRTTSPVIFRVSRWKNAY